MLNKSLNIFAEKMHELQLHLVQTFLMHVICSEIIQKNTFQVIQFRMTEGITPRVLLLTIKAL